MEITHRVRSCPANFPPHLNFNGPRPSALTCNDTLEQAPSPTKEAATMPHIGQLCQHGRAGKLCACAARSHVEPTAGDRAFGSNTA